MQADAREAGSRELVAPATEGAESPLDQPVTGSASRSAYHRKLAERLAKRFNQMHLYPADIAAALASEGVVDPAELGSLRNFMEQRRGKPVEMVSGAAIRTIEEQDAELAAMRSTADSDG